MVIIALHYHCYDWLVGLFFFFMLKLLQYCNYIIIVMQIKLMLLLFAIYSLTKENLSGKELPTANKALDGSRLTF